MSTRWSEAELKTERLVLKPLGSRYLASVHAYAGNIENARMMEFLPNESIEETAEFLEKAEREWQKEQPDVFEFAILYEGEQVGAVSLYILKNEEQTGELGWILNKKYWNKGIVSEAAGAVAEFAGKEVGLKRLIASCDTENTASYRVMEKIGMRRVLMRGGRKNRASDEERKEYLYEIII